MKERQIVEKLIVVIIAVLTFSAALGWTFWNEEEEEKRILRNHFFEIRRVPTVASLASNVHILGFDSAAELNQFKKKLFRIEKISFADIRTIHKYVENGTESVLVVEDKSGMGKTLEFKRRLFGEWRVHRCSNFIACQ